MASCSLINIYIYLIVQENKKLQGGKSKAAFSLPQMQEVGAWTDVIFDLRVFTVQNQDVFVVLTTVCFIRFALEL